MAQTRATYVSQPTDELLAVLAIEAERAGAVVIGEDLGTVAPGVRRRLASANVLSTRLALFEPRPPKGWPRKAMAGITTHDLPTVAGTWTGADFADQARAGVQADRRGLPCCGAASPGWPACNRTRRWPT